MVLVCLFFVLGIVIVSENWTWQKSIALFLQEKLNLLTIDSPFLLSDSEEVIDFLTDCSDKDFKAFSGDIKYLYYSPPQNLLLTSVEECNDTFGAIAFQNETRISPK